MTQLRPWVAPEVRPGSALHGVGRAAMRPGLVLFGVRAGPGLNFNFFLFGNLSINTIPSIFIVIQLHFSHSHTKIRKMPPRREGQRAIEAQMTRMLETAMPAIQEEINNEVKRYQAAIQAWNEQLTYVLMFFFGIFKFQCCNFLFSD